MVLGWFKHITFTVHSISIIIVCVCESLNHVWLFVSPWTVARQASLSMEFSRQKYWEWIAISFSRGTSQPRDRTLGSGLLGKFFIIWATGDLESMALWQQWTHPQLRSWFLWQLTPVFLPREFHGQRSLVGYSHEVTESWTQLSD